MSDQYYVRRAGKISGPAKAKLLEQYAANGKLQVTDEVATSPNGPWHAVSKVPLLANHLPAADELADPFGDPLAAASVLADGASVQPTSRPAKPQGRPSSKPSGGRAQRPAWLVPLLAGSGVVVVLLVAGAVFLLWGADESGLIGSWQGKQSGPQGEIETRWTFNEDGTGNMGFGALAPSMPFTWESAGADRVTITLAFPNGQSEETMAIWAVSGDTLTFTREGSPEKLVLKRASTQSAPKHPEYLAHTWKSHPVLSNGPKQTAVFAKTGVLTLTTENGKPVQGTWEATGNQLTLSYPDTDSGELQTLVYQMTMGGADEEGTDTPISADLYLQGVGENKASLFYTRPLHPEGQDGASTEGANPSGEPGSMDGQTNVLPATPNKPQAKVDETAVQAAVAALEELGGFIKRNGQGETIEVRLHQNQNISDAEMVHLAGLTELQWLDLDGTSVTDAGMVHLVGLTKLTHLSLPYRITDAGLVHLKGLTNLETLHLKGLFGQITHAGLVHLKGLTNLKTLGLGFAKVTDTGMVHLAGLTELQWLDLTSTRITDAGMVHLKGMTNLKNLSLDGRNQITDAGLVHLKGLSSLQNLNLAETQITDAGLVHLKGLANLRELLLGDTQITDAGMVHLVGLTELRELRLGSDSQVSAAGRAKLQKALPNCNIREY